MIMKQNWNLSLKNKKPNGEYNIAVRYYEAGVEKYFDTEYRATRDEWQATSGRVAKEMESIRATLKAKIKETLDTIQQADHEPTFELFKSIWHGKSLSTERSWIALLDKHLELNPKFKYGTRRVYNDTRTLLAKMDKLGMDLSLSEFQKESDYEMLEGWFSKVGNIGKTSLAIHMQNIKAIANTGYDPRRGLKWVKSDAFKYYRKPDRKVGTHPNSLEQLKAIETFDVTTLSANRKHVMAYEFGRDFWCWMVRCGGMEARSIAFMLWENVHNDYFSFERAKVENKGGVEVVLSAKTAMTKYMFEKYAVKGGKYVFPVLSEDMSEAQQEAAITSLARRITSGVQRVADHLGIKPRPTCKRTRPTFAVVSDQLGMNIKKQQQMMGHKKISTTEIYMKNMPVKSKISASEEFDTALG